MELRTAGAPRRIAAASASCRALCNSPLLHRSPGGAVRTNRDHVARRDSLASSRREINRGPRSITDTRSIAAGHSVTRRVGGGRVNFCAGSDRWCNSVLSADPCDCLFARRYAMDREPNR